MDPDKAWEDTLEAMGRLEADPEDQELREEVAHQLRDIADWIERGGFIPREATT